MKKSPSARDAYVQAEVVTALAHQIRAIRMQRNWSQAALAQKLCTTQAAVSRLEDPAYGRMSVKTLLDLSRAFDTGLRVQFVSLVTMLHETHKPKADLREVPAFEDEAPLVSFYTVSKTLLQNQSVRPASVVMLDSAHLSLPSEPRQTLRFQLTSRSTTYLPQPTETAT